MIVVDTSAIIELTLNLPLSAQVVAHVEAADWNLHAPELLLIEAHQVLRRRVLARITPPDAAETARKLILELGITLHEHTPLVDRIWNLRANLTAYDAAYVALSEGLDAALLTSDSRLASAPGHRATVLLVLPCRSMTAASTGLHQRDAAHESGLPRH